MTAGAAPRKVIVGIQDPAVEGRLFDRLAGAGVEIVRVLEAGELTPAVDDLGADVVLVSTNLYGLGPAVLEELVQRHVPVVILTRAGEDAQYAPYGHVLPESAPVGEVADTVLRVAEERPEPSPLPDAGAGDDEELGGLEGQGQLVAVVRAHGGAGGTTFAAGLAAAVAAHRIGTALVAADPHGTRLAAHLDLDPTRNVVAAVHAATTGLSLTEAVVENLSAVDGVAVLAGPERAEAWRAVEGRGAALLGVLLRRYAVVVVDVGELPPEHDTQIAALRRADAVYLLAVPQVPGLERARVALTYLEHARRAGKVALVLTRAGGLRFHGAAEVEEALDVPVAAVLPEDRGAYSRAAAAQEPVTRAGGPAARAIAQLAAALAGQPVKRGGLLALVGR